MVFVHQPTAGPGGGFQPVSVRLHNVWNRTGATLVEGELVKLDFAAAATEVDGTDNDNLTPFATNSPFNTVAATVTADGTAPGNIFLICLESAGIADNAQGSFLMLGFTDKALSTGVFSVGEVMCPGIGELDDTASDRAIAIYLDVAGTAASEQKQCYFDGTGATIYGVHA